MVERSELGRRLYEKAEESKRNGEFENLDVSEVAKLFAKKALDFIGGTNEKHSCGY